MALEGLPNYSLASRVSTLILNRETALSLLRRAPADRYVLAAIAALEGEPDAGMPGGRARDFGRRSLAPVAPKPAPRPEPRQIDLRKNDRPLRPKRSGSRAPSAGFRAAKVPAAFYG